MTSFLLLLCPFVRIRPFVRINKKLSRRRRLKLRVNPEKKESKPSWGQTLFQEFFKIWGKLTKNNNQDVKDYKNLDLKVNSLKKRLNRHRALNPTFILKNWSPNWTSHWNPNWTNKRPTNWTPRFKQKPTIATRLIDSK